MNGLLARGVTWLEVAVVLALVSAVANLVLYLFAVGSLRKIFFMRRLTRVLADIPAAMPLHCEKKQVAATVLDQSTRRERAVPIYTGGITWSGGSRLAGRVRHQAKRQLVVRGLVFAVVFMPLFCAGLWGAL